MSTGGRVGCLGRLVGVLLFGVAVVYAVAAVTSPWSFHIGGRWTPFLYWSGYGKLVTKNGTYPLYISFYPSSHFSRLHLDGMRPTGGVKGKGWLCTAPGVIERLALSGTIYGGWSTTEGSLMEFRLNERNIIDLGQQRRGYFDLYGRWRGTKLMMDDRGRYSSPFSSGVKIEHPSVALDWGSYSDFKTLCASATNSRPGR
jgi:hypothetical protein